MSGFNAQDSAAMFAHNQTRSSSEERYGVNEKGVVQLMINEFDVDSTATCNIRTSCLDCMSISIENLTELVGPDRVLELRQQMKERHAEIESVGPKGNNHSFILPL